MCFIDAGTLLPDLLEPRTQPEALVADAKERIGVHAENCVPNDGSAGERWVPADRAGEPALHSIPKPKARIRYRQNPTGISALRKPGWRLTLCCEPPRSPGSRAPSKPGGRAVREIQHPERHCDKRDVHKDDPFRPPFLAFGPARHRIPEEKEPADQTGRRACSCSS